MTRAGGMVDERGADPPRRAAVRDRHPVLCRRAVGAPQGGENRAAARQISQGRPVMASRASWGKTGNFDRLGLASR